MSKSSKEAVLSVIDNKFGIPFIPVKGKSVFYEGKLPNGTKLLVCSPYSKLNPKGYGWVDITLIQIELMQSFQNAIFAFRIESKNTIYVHLSQLKPFLTENAMLENQNEKLHWKLHIWPNEIKVLGNDKQMPLQEFNIDILK